MNSLLSFKATQSITSIYQSLTSSKTRDKVDMILEPLQAMIQLALLSISPIGTKLHIQENILQLQSPTIIQPIARWYHADKKDDAYFLYGVIKRYLKWYNPQINIPIGPKGFGGLPGVILELEDGYRTYYPKEISINKNDLKINFNIPKKIEKISLDDFRRTYDDMKREYKNFIFEN